ncbi:MAG: hypothetical protein R3C15_04905 [Thermoleophilia bacterium]
MRRSLAIAALAVGLAAPAGAASAATYAVDSASGSVRIEIDGQHDGREGPDFAQAKATIRWAMTGKKNVVDLDVDELPRAAREPEWPGSPLRGIRGTATGTATVAFAGGRTATCSTSFRRLTKAFFERPGVPTITFVAARRDEKSIVVAIDGLDAYAPFMATPSCGAVLPGLPLGTVPATGRETRGTAVSLGRLERVDVGETLSLGVKRVIPLVGFADGKETTVATITERAKLVLRRTG